MPRGSEVRRGGRLRGKRSLPNTLANEISLKSRIFFQLPSFRHSTDIEIAHWHSVVRLQSTGAETKWKRTFRPNFWPSNLKHYSNSPNSALLLECHQPGDAQRWRPAKSRS